MLLISVPGHMNPVQILKSFFTNVTLNYSSIYACEMSFFHTSFLTKFMYAYAVIYMDYKHNQEYTIMGNTYS
jgi:hypothetical protein